MSARFHFASLLPLFLVARAATAQTVGSLDGGVTRVGYSDVPGLTAYSLSPTLQLFRPNATLVATGVFSEFDGGGWSLQGSSTGSVFFPRISALQAELGASLAGSTHDDGNNSAELLGLGRVHLSNGRRGAWVGGALGRAFDGVSWHTAAFVEGAAWARLGDATVVASASPTWTGDSLRFLDSEATVRWSRGAVELGAYGGVRSWFAPGNASATAWGGASASYWLGNHLAIVASGGSYPADFGQGFPGGSYVALTFRVATRRPPTPTRVESQGYRLLQPLARPVVPAFEIRTVRGASRMVRVRAPGAASVEIMGDFTDWRPVTLTQVGGDAWEAAVTIPTGTHRMNLRVNGGDWGVPPGVTALSDDFGGVVGVLVVE